MYTKQKCIIFLTTYRRALEMFRCAILQHGSKQYAELKGIDPAYFNRILKGKTTPSFENIIKWMGSKTLEEEFSRMYEELINLLKEQININAKQVMLRAGYKRKGYLSKLYQIKKGEYRPLALNLIGLLGYKKLKRDFF